MSEQESEVLKLVKEIRDEMATSKELKEESRSIKNTKKIQLSAEKFVVMVLCLLPAAIITYHISRLFSRFNCYDYTVQLAILVFAVLIFIAPILVAIAYLRGGNSED